MSDGMKQQMKKMLHDAICAFCENTISHKMHLLVEAVIGITVDNGEDILSVSINELLGKSNTATKREPVVDTVSYATSEHYSRSVTVVASDDDTSEQAEWLTADVDPSHYIDADEYEEDEMYDECQQTLPSANDYPEGPPSDYTLSSNSYLEESEVPVLFDNIKAELYAGDEYLDNSNNWLEPKFNEADVYQSADSSVHSVAGRRRMPQPNSSRGCKTGRGGKRSQPGQPFHSRIRPGLKAAMHGMKAEKKLKLLPSSVPPDFNQNQTSSGFDDFVGSVNESSEATCSQVFKCNMCSAEMPTHAQFIRHKARVHSNVLHRCLFCGKAFARPDSLKRHHMTQHSEHDSDQIYSQ